MPRRTYGALVAAPICGGTVQAATDASLGSEGHWTGPSSRNAAGLDGWSVTEEKSAYFCRRSGAMAYSAAPDVHRRAYEPTPT